MLFQKEIGELWKGEWKQNGVGKRCSELLSFRGMRVFLERANIDLSEQAEISP